MNRRDVISALTVGGIGFLPIGSAMKGTSEPKNKKQMVVFASETGAKLDADVNLGGGTDDTAILQAVLDKALENGGIYLIMDGAAMITGLRVHSNTTIECLNKSCGFFLAANSNCAILRNHNWLFEGEVKDRNISLFGGTYNHNCKEQEHHIANVFEDAKIYGKDKWVFGLEFYGIEHLNIRDITIQDQRTFALVIANWKYVNMENIVIDLRYYMWAQNQDGIHVFGPGEFLNMKNITGNSGDDFIAIAPDEIDFKSSISNVLIDGVFLDDADQGIRLLSRAEGRLDQIHIRNVLGSYKSFGFYIDHWFNGEGGNYGTILIENVNLKQLPANYDYTKPFLFRLAGNFEQVSLKNIVLQNSHDNRSLIDVGWPEPDGNHPISSTNIKSLLIDGIQVSESDPKELDGSYIKVNCEVDRMIIRNVEIINNSAKSSKKVLIDIHKDGKIGLLFMYNFYIESLRKVLLNRGSVNLLTLQNYLLEQIDEPIIIDEINGIKKLNL